MSPSVTCWALRSGNIILAFISNSWWTHRTQPNYLEGLFFWTNLSRCEFIAGYSYQSADHWFITVLETFQIFWNSQVVFYNYASNWFDLVEPRNYLRVRMEWKVGRINLSVDKWHVASPCILNYNFNDPEDLTIKIRTEVVPWGWPMWSCMVLKIFLFCMFSDFVKRLGDHEAHEMCICLKMGHIIVLLHVDP